MRLLDRSFARIRTVLAALALGSLALASQAGTTDIYYHNDLAGTPMAATDGAGNVLWRQGYKPYGERLDPKAPADQLPWYTGKAHVEAAGLSYFGARWYDPVLGRFMGVDPVGFSEANVHSFNRYAYANNNPYKFVDPDGRSAAAIVPIIGGAIVVGGGYRALPEDARRTIASGLATLGDYTVLGRLGSMVGQALLSEANSSDQSGSKGRMDGDGAKTVDELVGESKKGRETKGRADQYVHDGGREQRDRDFDSLGATNIRDRGNGTKTGTLPDGRPVNVHDSKQDRVPTIQVGNGNRDVKIRYP